MSKISSNNASHFRTHTPSSSTSTPNPQATGNATPTAPSAAPAFNYAAAASRAKHGSNASSAAPTPLASSPALGPTTTSAGPGSGTVTPIPSLTNGKPSTGPNSGSHTPAGGVSHGRTASVARRHSKEPSVSASRPIGIGIKDSAPSVNFGTIDDSSAVLSSSPAAPPSHGGHLGGRAPHVFGSISAEGSPNNTAAGANGTSPMASTPAAAPAAVASSTPAKTASAPAPKEAAPPAAIDFNQLFGVKPESTPETSAPPATSSPVDSRRPTLPSGPSSGPAPTQGPGGPHAPHLSTQSRPFSPGHGGPPPMPSPFSQAGPGGFGGQPHFGSPHVAHHPGQHPHPHGVPPQGHVQSPGGQPPPQSPFQSHQPGSGPAPNGIAPGGPGLPFSPGHHVKTPSAGPQAPHYGPGTPGGGPGGFQQGPPQGPQGQGQQGGRGPSQFGQMHGNRPHIQTQPPHGPQQHQQQQQAKFNHPSSPRMGSATPQPPPPMNYPYPGAYPQQYYGYYVPGQPPQYGPMTPVQGPPGPGVASPVSQNRGLPNQAGTPSTINSGAPSWPGSQYHPSPSTTHTTLPPTPSAEGGFRPPPSSNHASSFNISASEFKPREGSVSSHAPEFKPATPSTFKRASAAVQIRRPPADMKPPTKHKASLSVASPATASAATPATPASSTSTPATPASAPAPSPSPKPSAAVTPTLVKEQEKKEVVEAKKEEKPAAPVPKVEEKKEEVKPVVEEKEEVKPVVEEKKVAEPKVEEKKPEPKVEEKKPEPKVEEKKVEEKKAEEKKEEVKATPVVNGEVKAQDKLEDKIPEPVKEKEVEPVKAKEVEKQQQANAEEASTTTSTIEPGEIKETPVSSSSTESSLSTATPVSAAPGLSTVAEVPSADQVNGKPQTNGVPSSADDEKKTRRAVPPLDLSAVAARRISTDGQPQTASMAALGSARPITDLKDVTYPDHIQSPKPELNTDAQPGKFRYDRGFLLQFMEICKEKPDALPPLEAIGMMEDGNSTPGGIGLSRPSSLQGSRRPSGPPQSANRTPSMGGFPMGLPSRASSFAAAPMGQFVNKGGAGGLTSQERFEQATNIRAAQGLPGAPAFGLPGRPGGMSRQPSTGPAGLGMNAGQRSSRGGKRRGERDPRPPAPQMLSTGEVVQPLEQTENRWQTTAQSGNTQDPLSVEMVQRKVKALLNKLTLENFDSIARQILDWANKSEQETDGRILRQVIALIFEKATDEAFWSSLYARLCRYLMEKLGADVKDHNILDAQGSHLGGGQLFRKYLLTRCQEDYEKGWNVREAAVAAAAAKAAEDDSKKQANEEAAKGDKPKEAELLSDEYYAAQKAKRRGLGLVSFIGELSKLGMLTDKIMHECIVKLLSNVDKPEEEDVESLCRLLRTVGKNLDKPGQSQQRMDVYFTRIQELLSDKTPLDQRLKFMVQDIVDLRKEKWVARNEQAGPKTIAEIHQQAEVEKQEKEAADRRAASQGKGLPRMTDQLNRAGSRRGQGRADSFQQGVDGWNTVGTPAARAPPPKVGDMSQLGRIREGRGSSLFAKKRDDKTPAASKTSNPFGMLAADPGDGGVAAPAPAPETPSERPRLNLKPRTKPLSSEGAATPSQLEPDVEAETDAATGEMPAEIKQSIKNSVDEFFAVRNIDEAVAVFSGLDTAWHTALVTAITEKVIEKKADDVALTAKLYTRLAADNVLSRAGFKDSFAPVVKTMADLAADIPNLYKFTAQLLVAAGLESDDVTSLSETMEAEEEDKEDAMEQFVEAYKKESSS